VSAQDLRSGERAIEQRATASVDAVPVAVTRTVDADSDTDVVVLEEDAPGIGQQGGAALDLVPDVASLAEWLERVEQLRKPFGTDRDRFAAVPDDLQRPGLEPRVR